MGAFLANGTAAATPSGTASDFTANARKAPMTTAWPGWTELRALISRTGETRAWTAKDIFTSSPQAESSTRGQRAAVAKLVQRANVPKRYFYLVSTSRVVYK